MMTNSSDRLSRFTVTTADGTNLQGTRIKPDKSIYSLIVVHGVGEHSERYLTFAKKISAINCSCYLYDQRGHGNSDGKRGHITKFEEYSNDLLKIYDLVSSESKKNPIFVYGHSMGSIVAVLFTLNHQEKINGLIITGFPFKPGIPISCYTLKLVKIICKIIPFQSIPTMINVKHLSHDEKVWNAYKQDNMINKTVTFCWVAEFYSVLDRLKNDLLNLELPLLIMHGGEDRIARLKGAKQAVQSIHSKDKTLHIFEGQRHELLNELPPTPNQVIDYMQNWIQLRLQKLSSDSCNTERE